MKNNLLKNISFLINISLFENREYRGIATNIIQMPLYDIYVFKLLICNKFFLYPKRRYENNDTNVMIECKCLYCLENEMLQLCEKIEMVKQTEIDGHVIQWMSQEGIDHVRGGSFTDTVLSDATKEYISRQIKYMNYDLEKNDDIIKKLQGLTDISFSNLSNMHQKICKCKNIHEQINQYYPAVSIEDLNWLRAKIDTSLSGEWKFIHIIDKYNELMRRLTTLYKQYKEYQKFHNDEVIHTIDDVPYLSSPHMYFDARIISEERRRSTGEGKDDEVFKTYETLIYTLLNRTDELKFDIQDFDLEWEEIKYRYYVQLFARQ